MPQSKEVHKEYMRQIRKAGKQAHTAIEARQYEDIGSQDGRVHNKGSQNWETMPLKDIISALPQDIIDYIENVSSRYGLREQRLRRAYKYQVWHNENFINGIHKDSKYLRFIGN